MSRLLSVAFVIFITSPRGRSFPDVTLSESDHSPLLGAVGSSLNTDDFRENFPNEPELIAPLIRREANDWGNFQAFMEPESLPWSSESYDQVDDYKPKLLATNNSASNFDHHENGSLRAHQRPTEIQYGFPQYVQKNYYNNFYLVEDGRQMGVWSAERESKTLESLNRPKLIRKNDCKEIVEILKSAFEKLKEIDYRDDLKTPSGVQMHLYGPTLYVENFGNVPQSNRPELSHRKIGAPPGMRRGPFPFNDFDFDSTVATNQINDSEENTTPHPFTTELNNPTEFHIDQNSPELISAFQTTVAPIVDHSSEIYFPTTKKIFPEENDQRSGEGMEETETTPLINTFTGVPTLYDNQLPYWITPSSLHPTRATLSPPNTPWTFYEESDDENADNFEENKEDVDCNDKMLPCPDTVNVTYPLNGYCNRYVTCESGMAVRRVCTNGLHFNLITKSCDLPHNSICTYACPERNGIYGIPGDCGGYFICKNSVLEYRMCPPKMHWDLKRQKCIFEELSSCPMKCDVESKVKNYEGDCKAYVLCLQGIPYYHKCPPNTKFDEMSQTCVPEDQSKCEDDPRLLVKTLNPNVLCNNIMKKFGRKSWCDFFGE